jgi:hypothetical protein
VGVVRSSQAVTETNVFQLRQRGTFAEPLTEGLRNGAGALLSYAVAAQADRRRADLCLSQNTAVGGPPSSGRRLKGENQLPKVVRGVNFQWWRLSGV